MIKIPQHRVVYEKLRKHIVGGVYSEGDMLPSENELCVIHDVTRPTIRKALDALLNEGYIKKQQGKGSIIRGAPKGVGILSLSGTTSAVGEENLKTRIIVKPEIRKWDKAFTFNISEMEKEMGCIYMERLRLVNEKPVFYDLTMIPNINLPRFTSRSLENKSLFDVLRKHYQVQVKGGEQQLIATIADEKIRHHFNIPEGHPVLQLNRKMDTNRMNFYFYSQVFCNTDEYVLEGTF